MVGSVRTKHVGVWINVHLSSCKWLHRAHLPPAAKTEQSAKDASPWGSPFKAGHKGIPYLASGKIPHSQQMLTFYHIVYTDCLDTTKQPCQLGKF